MRKYIFITPVISGIGGIQCLIAGKAKYLESDGWEVFILHSGYYGKENIKIDYLSKFERDRFWQLIALPEYYPKFIRHWVLNQLTGHIIKDGNNTDEIVIESHTDKTALWGELIAEKMRAKHFFFICHEKFRGPGKYYESHLDFFDFKHRRKEIAGEVKGEIQHLFEGYKTVNDDEDYLFELDEDPVQEVYNEKIENISKKDWNICYIGRATKNYVPNILKGVSRFAKKHKNKTINFILIGDASSRRENINQLNDENSNLAVLELGDVVPIPKSLFKKIDVCIAGSGSARCSVYEGVPTILADADTFLSDGLLGYDTKDFLFNNGEKGKDFDIDLERVFVEEVHKKIPFEFIPKIGPKECTLQNFDLMKKSEQSLAYYDENMMCNKKSKFLLIIKLSITNCLHYLPGFSMLYKKAFT